ncbi:MAG: hypothetical protein PHX62_02005, partial [Bacilli bacterium]|nr:hypothetical protein [Bacilli bacterium]
MKRLFGFLLMVLAFGFLVGCDEDNPPIDVVPTFENVSIQAGDEAGEISVLITAKESEATIYYIVVAENAKAPTFEQIKAGVNYDDVTVLKKGTAKATISENVVLEEGIVYSIYVILELNEVFNENVYTNQVLTKTEEETADKGTGTLEDPFRISTVSDLENMLADDLFVRDAYYKLMNDLDLSTAGYKEDGKSWVPIGKQLGSLVKFSGEFDGDNHSIKNLYMNSSSAEEKWGLFAELEPSGVIKNLSLENVNITAAGQRVGSFVGYSKGTVANVSVTGNIKGKDSGDADVGGIVGYQNNSGTIRYAYSAVNIQAGGRRLGGIAGVTEVAVGDTQALLVSDSYSTGNITGEGPDARQVGGIVGYTRGTEFERVYASGDITGTKEVGGLVGFMEQRADNTIVPKLKNSFFMGARVTKNDASNSQVGKIIGNLKEANGKPEIANVYAASTTLLVGGEGGSTSVHGETTDLDNFKNMEWITANLIWSAEIWEVKASALRPTLKGNADDGSYTVPKVPLIITLVEFGEGENVGEMILRVETNLEADIYYVVVGVADAAPTDEQVIAMANYGEVTLVDFGTIKGTILNASLTALTEGEEYTVYILAKLEDEVKAENKTAKPKGTAPKWGGENPEELGYYPIYLPSDLEEFSILAAAVNTINGKLMQDIDFADYYDELSAGFLPIGSSDKKYKGTFDGNNHKILNLFINRPEEQNVGLFGYTDIETSRNKAATITNLTIENANITAKNYAGILIGRSKADVSNITIINGVVNAVDLADSRVGGLIGFHQQGVIDKVFVDA